MDAIEHYKVCKKAEREFKEAAEAAVAPLIEEMTGVEAANFFLDLGETVPAMKVLREKCDGISLRDAKLIVDGLKAAREE